MDEIIIKDLTKFDSRAHMEKKITEYLGTYKVRSPYHHNKWLPFEIDRINYFNGAFPLHVSAVEYKGRKRYEIQSDYSIEVINEMIKTGKLRKTCKHTEKKND